MNRSRITDEDAAALLDGVAPGGRAELRAVSEAIARIRAASQETVARPSSELLLLLGSDAAREPVDASGGVDDRVGAWGPARGKVLRMFGWFTGLGLGVKALLMGGVAAAAVAGAATFVTMPPEVPAPVASETAQPSATAEPSESLEPSADPSASPSGVPTFEPCAGSFGEQVSPVAQDKPGSGREFGEGVSSAAQEKGDCAEGADEGEQDVPETEPGADADERGGRSEHAPRSTNAPNDNASENAGGGAGGGRGR